MAGKEAARRIARYVYLVLILLFVAGVLVQAMLAGRFLFAGADTTPHVELGWPLAHMLAPLALLLSFFLGGGRRFWITSIVWGILALVQPILAVLDEDGPSQLEALHVPNALVLFALSLWLSWQAWTMAMAPKAPPVVNVVRAPPGTPAIAKSTMVKPGPGAPAQPPRR